MGTTQPIRNRQELQNFSSYYKQGKTASAKLYFSCIGIKHCTKNQRSIKSSLEKCL